MRKFETNVREIVKDELSNSMKPVAVAIGAISALGVTTMGLVTHLSNKHTTERMIELENNRLRKENEECKELLHGIYTFLERLNIQVKYEEDDEIVDDEETSEEK